MAEIEWPTVAELADQVRRKERAAVEVVDQALAAIEAGNDALNAFVVVDADLARTRRRRRRRGRRPGRGSRARSPACPSA